MSIAEIAYLAGLVDGEGCIMINRFATSRSPIGFQYRIILEITMCERDTIEFIADKFDRPIEQRIIPSGKTAFKVIWRNQPAASILELLVPYLHGKRKQAEVCLEFQKLVPGRGRTYKPSDAVVLENLRLKVKWLKSAEALRC